MLLKEIFRLKDHKQEEPHKKGKRVIKKADHFALSPISIFDITRKTMLAFRVISHFAVPKMEKNHQQKRQNKMKTPQKIPARLTVKGSAKIPAPNIMPTSIPMPLR